MAGSSGDPGVRSPICGYDSLIMRDTDNRTRSGTSPETAAAAVRRLYGFEGSAEPLPGEYDDNFRITADNGTRHVLKIMHPERDPALIDLQVAALSHLARTAPQIGAPRIRLTPDGRSSAVMDDQDGQKRLVWMLEYIEGRPYGQTQPRDASLRHSLGSHVAALDAALASFDHPAAHRDLKWDSSRADWITTHWHEIRDERRRTLVQRMFAPYLERVVPALPAMRRSVIHADANECNTLTATPPLGSPKVVGLIDYGDMHHGITLSGLAIACAYAAFGETDALRAVSEVVAGYHAQSPIPSGELPLLFPLIAARLCVSVVNSGIRARLLPDDPYATISEQPAWAVLDQWADLSPELALARLRIACGEAPGISVLPDVRIPLIASRVEPLDLSVGSLWLGANPATLEPTALARRIQGVLNDPGALPRVTSHGEIRLRPDGNGGRGWAQLGVDVFAGRGTPIRAPWNGRIEWVQPRSAGGVSLMLRQLQAGHRGICLRLEGLEPGETFHAGQDLTAGAALGQIEHGDESLPLPHLRVSLLGEEANVIQDWPFEVPADDAQGWLPWTLDPAPLFDGAPTRPIASDPVSRRRAVLGPNLSVSYRHPLEIVRGWRQYLYDRGGRAYLDVFNNVPLVGHSHPRVVEAASRQLALLNTNTRYLHPVVLEYAERLTALMPAPLRVCYFLNSASEANDLALRMARTVTGRREVIVLEHAYHGHTQSLIDVSPYKFNGPGGAGRSPEVHVAPIPDDYRGEFRRDDPRAGERYAERLASLIQAGARPAAFIAETLPSVGGQVVLPPGYLAHAYAHVRAAGGLCIADEVQVGFGRLGRYFWGFESQSVVPDMVVLGKPIGNAFPLAALVTTAEIAGRFDNGMEFFSTFGGNPVAVAAGLAVLDALRDEALPANAQRVGAHLLAGLRELQHRHRLIGDVRGMGLFLGVELVRDVHTREPATAEATHVVNRLRERGILAGTDGPHHNVIKIRPPLCIDRADADLFLNGLDAVLSEDALLVPA